MTKKELVERLNILDDDVEVAISIGKLNGSVILEDVYEDTDLGYIYLTN